MKISRKIAAAAMSLFMIGGATIPTVSEKLTTPTVACAYWSQNISPCTFRVKGNTVFRAAPSSSAKVVASISKTSTITATKVEVNSSGTWYYSKYDKAWVNSSRFY